MADMDRHGPEGITVSGLANPLRDRQPTNVRGLILVLACGTSFVLYLHRYVWGFVKKDIQDAFDWSDVELGWLDGLFPASYGVCQIPAGMLGDWFGAHLLLGSSILLWSLALAGVAVATGVASMAAARLTLGVAQAGCYPVLNKVSKSWFPVAVRTTAQGWIATFFGRAGGALSFFLFGTVLVGWLGLGWRTAVCVFSALGLAWGLLFLHLFRNTPRDHPWANAAEAELITADDPVAARASGSRLHWGQLLQSGTGWLLCARAFASNMADVLFVYWVPLYLRRVWGVSPVDAGWLAALPLLGGALGGLASGMLQSRLIAQGRLRGLSLRRRRWARAGIALTGKLLAAGLMLACLFPLSALTISCLFLAAKFFSDWEQPAEWGAISDVAGANAATVFACVNTAGALGGVVASPLIGLVVGAYGGGTAGWNAAFVLIALEFLVAAACWLFINCDRPIGPAVSEEPT